MAVAPKGKRRNSEKRKEHSRDAARCRRSREAEVFLNLAREIPLTYDLVKLLDKTSIIRLTITYLKLRTLLANGLIESALGIGQQQATTYLQHHHQALDGFVMVVASDGDILFVTDNITSCLGLTQIDILGQSIFDVSHPCDHDEIREMIGAKSHQSDDTHRASFIRMKSTLTSKGRNVHIKSASYKVISCYGHPKTAQLVLPGSGEGAGGGGSGAGGEEAVPFVVIIGQSIAHPSNGEVPFDSQTFISHHSLDMKFTECDERVHDLIGYHSDDLIAKSMYLYHHALDSEVLERTFKTLFCKGQVSTGLYRFLARNGGYVWIETHATVINNAVTDKPEYVSCINYVISGVEESETVFDAVQLSSKIEPSLTDIGERKCDEENMEDMMVFRICPDVYQDEEQDGDQSCFQFVTEKILGQAVKEKEEIGSELSPCDVSLYSLNKMQNGKTDLMPEDDENLGMTKNLSNTSLTSFLENLGDGLEMRAPYISMDDLVFGSASADATANLSQTFGDESHLSCLIHSDPLLPSSVEHESLLMSESISPLFTLNVPDAQSNIQPPPVITQRMKRPFVSDQTTVPCKTPRLELFNQDCLPISNIRKSFTSANGTSGSIIYVPSMTNGQKTFPERSSALTSSKGHNFFQAGKTFQAPEEVCPTVEIGQETTSQAVYLLLNGQEIGPLTFTTAQTKSGLSLDGQSDQQVKTDGSTVDMNMLQRNGTGQLMVSGIDGPKVQGVNFVLNLTNPGSHTGNAGHFLTADNSGLNTGSLLLGPNSESKAEIFTTQTSVCPMMMSSQQQTISEICTVPRVLESSSGLTNGKSLTLVQPKTTNVVINSISSGVAKQSLLQGNGPSVENMCSNIQSGGVGSNIQDLLESLGKMNSQGRVNFLNGREQPQQQKMQNGIQGGIDAKTVIEMQSRTENQPKMPSKANDMLFNSQTQYKSMLINNSITPKPLHLLQEGVVQSRYRTSGQVSDQGTNMQKQLVIPCTMTSGIVDSRGQQQMSKPGAQVVIRQVKPDQVAAGKGRGYNIASLTSRMENTFMAKRQRDTTADEQEMMNNSQQLMASCTGSVLDSSGSSVLMNLLMKGVDVNYGYRLQSRSIPFGNQKQMAEG